MSLSPTIGNQWELIDPIAHVKLPRNTLDPGTVNDDVALNCVSGLGKTTLQKIHAMDLYAEFYKNVQATWMCQEDSKWLVSG